MHSLQSVRHNFVLLDPYLQDGAYFRPCEGSKPVTLTGECARRFIKCLQENKQILPLIENDLQSLCELPDGTPLLTSMIPIETYQLFILESGEAFPELIAAFFSDWRTSDCTTISISFKKLLLDELGDYHAMVAEAVKAVEVNCPTGDEAFFQQSRQAKAVNIVATVSLDSLNKSDNPAIANTLSKLKNRIFLKQDPRNHE